MKEAGPLCLAVTVGFEPTEAVNLTRFRGVLLRPLGHVTLARMRIPVAQAHSKPR